MPDFEITQGDLLPSFRVQIKEDGAILDLTTAVSADVIIYNDIGGGVPGTALLNLPAVIETPKTNGIVRYDWVAGQTNNPGLYLIQVEIMWPSSKPETAPTGAKWTMTIWPALEGTA